MEYLFLRRRETISTSQRQKDLLFKAAEKHWKEEIVMRGRNNREIDCLIYKKLLYQLEIRMVFLDSELSLTKLSVMIDTNQTYLSNVVNRYFECNLKGLLNRYRQNMRRSCCKMAIVLWKIFRRNVVSLQKVLFIQLSKK